MNFQPKLNFKIRSDITNKVEFLQLIKTQLEVTDTNFRPIHEDNRSLPNDADRKSKLKVCKMDVTLIYNFMRNPKMNFILLSEVGTE